VLDSEAVKEYSLLPGEKQTLETFICCNYRGEYYVGAQTVKITDFLYLFTITYPVVSKMKVTVFPRVVSLSNIKIISANMDSKGRINPYKNEDEQVDLEVRKYMSGDNKKLIHWKASAKRNELMTRKYVSIPKANVTICMDLASINELELQKVIVEDKIIEATIAMADYFSKRHIACEILYDYDGAQRVSVQNQLDFDLFYHRCVYMRFLAKTSVEQLIANHFNMEGLKYEDKFQQYIVITHCITEELYKTVLHCVSEGNECGIIFVNQQLTSDMENLLRLIRKAGVNIIILHNEDEIADLL
jgi:hypothetical protein